jgi:hypothetical protein
MDGDIIKLNTIYHLLLGLRRIDIKALAKNSVLQMREETCDGYYPAWHKFRRALCV